MRFCSPGDQLIEANVKLRDYNGKPLDVAGVTIVTVDYKSCYIQLPIVVIRGDRPLLLGRNWLRHIQLDWRTLFGNTESVNVVSAKDKADQLCDRYNDLFRSEVGCLKDLEVSLPLKSDAAPAYRDARSVPYQRHPLVDAELRRLEEAGLRSIQFVGPLKALYTFPPLADLFIPTPTRLLWEAF